MAADLLTLTMLIALMIVEYLVLLFRNTIRLETTDQKAGKNRVRFGGTSTCNRTLDAIKMGRACP